MHEAAVQVRDRQQFAVTQRDDDLRRHRVTPLR